jgi:hypothetical protein
MSTALIQSWKPIVFSERDVFAESLNLWLHNNVYPTVAEMVRSTMLDFAMQYADDASVLAGGWNLIYSMAKACVLGAHPSAGGIISPNPPPPIPGEDNVADEAS